MAAVYQRQLSLPSLWGQSTSISESWGVKGIPCIVRPVSVVS